MLQANDILSVRETIFSGILFSSGAFQSHFHGNLDEVPRSSIYLPFLIFSVFLYVLFCSFFWDLLTFSKNIVL